MSVPPAETTTETETEPVSTDDAVAGEITARELEFVADISVDSDAVQRQIDVTERVLHSRGLVEGVPPKATFERTVTGAATLKAVSCPLEHLDVFLRGLRTYVGGIAGVQVVDLGRWESSVESDDE